jgi:hypothetical protein
MSNKRPKKSSKSAEPMSPRDLKQWLAGMMEGQPSDWSPSPGQWKAIKDRIYALEEYDVQYEPQYETAVVANRPQVVHYDDAPAAHNAFSPAYAPAQPPPQAALGALSGPHMPSGPIALPSSPNESGIISATVPPEGPYKTPF